MANHDQIHLLCAAGDDLRSLIHDVQDVMVRFLVPDGISAEVAMAEIIALLDNKGQRALEDRWDNAKAGCGWVQ